MATRRASPAARRRWRRWPPWSGPGARWGWVAVWIAAAGLLGYALVGVADWILRVVARVIWFIDSLHQGLVWTVLLAILAYLTLRLGARARAVRTAPRPSVAPQPSELASLAGTIRRAGMSPSARHELAGRLRGIAVELRTQREAIPTQRAWEELEDGEWPPHPALAAVLRPRDSRTPPLQRGDHLRQIDRAVNALWNYAQGGEFDDR